MHILTGCIPGLLAVLVMGSAAAADNPGLDSDRERLSYSAGYQAVEQLRAGGRETDLAALLRGALDALSDSPQLDDDARRALLMTLQAAQGSPGVRDELTPISQGRDFLAANTGKPDVTTLPSGLQYRVLRTGSGKKPRLADTVVVHYRGSRVDGTPIDSAWRDDKPAVYRVDEVMPGWTEALQLMPEGSEWELYIPSRLAFGKRGPLENQVLVYRIHLLAVIGEQAASDKP